MTISEFIKQYGTDTTSLMLEKVASYIEGTEEKEIITELANALRSSSPQSIHRKDGIL